MIDPVLLILGTMPAWMFPLFIYLLKQNPSLASDLNPWAAALIGVVSFICVFVLFVKGIK